MNTKDLMRIYGMPATVAKKISADPSEFRYWHKCGEEAYNGCLKWIDKRDNCNHCQLCQKCCRCVIYDGNSLLESVKSSVNQNTLSLEPKAEPKPQIILKVNTQPTFTQPTQPTNNTLNQLEKQTPIPTSQKQTIAVPGKMEVIIKTSEYPEDAKTVTNNWKEFVVNTGDKEVIVTVRPKVFNKLEQAKAQFPQWVAAINGKIGNINQKGFNLIDASIQVFEKKSKPETPLPEQSKQQNTPDTIKSTSTIQPSDQQPVDDIAATAITQTQSQLIQESSVPTTQQAITGETTRPEITLTTLKLNSKLSALDITHFDKDIRLMSSKELKANFAASSSGRILLTKLMKNIIWQAYERIKDGSEAPIEGNIRTFWYLWVKPVLSHFSSAKLKSDPYDVLTQTFSQLILEHKLFSYQDFDFTDGNWENRRIGETKPHILVFAEKTGWIHFLRELNQQLGCSIIVLGGLPSALSSAYTAKHIREVLPSPQTPLKLIGIVDFDPSGHIVAQAFQNQLASCGLTSSSLTLLIDPKYYSKEQIEVFKFPLPKAKSQKTKLQLWLKQTGGIDSQPFGLESESMPRNKLKDLVKELIS